MVLFSDNIEIRWQLKPGIRVDRRKIDLQGSRLTLYDLRRSDNGEYACTGTNELGSTKFTFQLDVYGMSSPTRVPLEVHVAGHIHIDTA